MEYKVVTLIFWSGLICFARPHIWDCVLISHQSQPQSHPCLFSQTDRHGCKSEFQTIEYTSRSRLSTPPPDNQLDVWASKRSSELNSNRMIYIHAASTTHIFVQYQEGPTGHHIATERPHMHCSKCYTICDLLKIPSVRSPWRMVTFGVGGSTSLNMENKTSWVVWK